LQILSILIDNFENENFPIDFPDPIEAIKFRMEQMGYKQSDLGNVVGFKGRAGEILNKKRKLSLDQIRKINKSFNIPAEALLMA
jgi:HTH-type transcriptional regulator / antitoxin HigA